MDTLFAQMWYAAQMKMISEWLSERLDISLHPYQLTCLLNITRASYSYITVGVYVQFCELNLIRFKCPRCC